MAAIYVYRIMFYRWSQLSVSRLSGGLSLLSHNMNPLLNHWMRQVCLKYLKNALFLARCFAKTIFNFHALSVHTFSTSSQLGYMLCYTLNWVYECTHKALNLSLAFDVDAFFLSCVFKEPRKLTAWCTDYTWGTYQGPQPMQSAVYLLCKSGSRQHTAETVFVPLDHAYYYPSLQC